MINIAKNFFHFLCSFLISTIKQPSTDTPSTILFYFILLVFFIVAIVNGWQILAIIIFILAILSTNLQLIKNIICALRITKLFGAEFDINKDEVIQEFNLLISEDEKLTKLEANKRLNRAYGNALSSKEYEEKVSKALSMLGLTFSREVNVCDDAPYVADFLVKKAGGNEIVIESKYFSSKTLTKNAESSLFNINRKVMGCGKKIITSDKYEIITEAEGEIY